MDKCLQSQLSCSLRYEQQDFCIYNRHKLAVQTVKPNSLLVTLRATGYEYVTTCDVCRQHSYVQLCAELQGTVPCFAPQAAAASDRVQKCP